MSLTYLNCDVVAGAHPIASYSRKRNKKLTKKTNGTSFVELNVLSCISKNHELNNFGLQM